MQRIKSHNVWKNYYSRSYGAMGTRARLSITMCREAYKMYDMHRISRVTYTIRLCCLHASMLSPIRDERETLMYKTGYGNRDKETVQQLRNTVNGKIPRRRTDLK